MHLYPSLNHINIWELEARQWWAFAKSVDDWRLDQRRKERESRHRGGKRGWGRKR